MTNPRVLKVSTIRGMFPIPIGLQLFRREPGDHPRIVEVSTVCLEGGHLESPIRGMLDAEHGYETMVFFQGCSLFGIYQQHYDTRVEALRGHKTAVRKLLAGNLPLSIQLSHYVVHEEIPNGEQTKAA